MRDVIACIAACAVTIWMLSLAFGQGSGSADIQACVSRAQKLTAAIQVYARDYDGRLPRMDTAANMKSVLLPYTRSQDTFNCPVTNSAYQPNPAASYKLPSQVNKDYSKVELFRDAVTHTDGKPTVAFFDGHIERGGVTVVDPPEARCLANARALALALLAYANDNEERLPPLQSAETFEAAVSPYITDKTRFFCPDTRLNYSYNATLNGKSLSDFTGAQATTEVLRDTHWHADGMRTVAYLDTSALRAVQFPWQAVALAASDDNNPRLMWRRGSRLSLHRLNAAGEYVSRTDHSRIGFTGGPLTMTVAPDGSTCYLTSHWTTGEASLRFFSPTGTLESLITLGPFPSWLVTDIAADRDGKTRALWFHPDGVLSLITYSASGAFEHFMEYGPYPGWTPVALSVGSDNRSRVLWRHFGGTASIVVYSPEGMYETYFQYGPFEDWTAVTLSTGADNKTRMLWSHLSGVVSIVTTSERNQFETFAEHAPPPP